MTTIVHVTHMDRSVQFYRDTLGLRLSFMSPWWSEFTVGGGILALQAGARGGPAEETSRSPSARSAGTAEVGFLVDDVDQVCADLIERGARIVSPPVDRPEQGVRLAEVRDPDGLIIYFAQSIPRQPHN